MIDGHGGALPSLVERVLEESKRTGIRFGSDMRVGALLRVLAASKPGGDLLELGTGTGLGTAWLLAGMTAGATLVSIDDDEVAGVATRALGGDPRLTLLHMDAGAFLSLRALSATSRTFDLIFADAPPGKLSLVDLAIDALKPGGLYVVDDMIEDPSEPFDDVRKASLADLERTLTTHPHITWVGLPWATGVWIAAKTMG